MTNNDILYVATRGCKVYKYNVSTDTVTLLVSGLYPSGQSCDSTYGYPIIKGWTGSGFTYPNRMMIMFVDDTGSSWNSRGVAFVSESGEINWMMSDTNYRSICDSGWPDLGIPWMSHGHGAVNPSKTLYADRCATTGTDDLCITDIDSCDYLYSALNTSPIDTTHFSWSVNENWFISNTGGKGSDFSAPTLYDYHIHQTIYDAGIVNVTHKKLLTQQTAHAWTDASGIRYSNYNAHFISTLRKDGGQVIFTSTGGKYSHDDCAAKSSVACPGGWSDSSWGFEGFYLVDLAPVNSDTTPPAAPSGVRVD